MKTLPFVMLVNLEILDLYLSNNLRLRLVHHLSLFTLTFGVPHQLSQQWALITILVFLTILQGWHIFLSNTKALITILEVLNVFIHYQSLVENMFDKRIKIIQPNWRWEFRPFAPLLKAKWIEFQHHCPHISEQNDIIERKRRHIVEIELSLLAQASMLLRY